MINKTIEMKYIGILKLLSECSTQVDEETRECIESAFEDSEEYGVRWSRTLDLIEITGFQE